MNLTCIFTQRTRWMALAIVLMASLTIIRFTDFSAKAAHFTSEPLLKQTPPDVCQLSFDRVLLETGHSLVIGDFNLDGKPDVAVTRLHSNDVSIQLGNGSGSFTQAAGSPIGVGIWPDAITSGDFNLDGKPDLAVVNRDSNNLTILLGDGNGSFSNATGSPINVGAAPTSVGIGDFNLDGKLDLVTANSGSNNLAILLGDGSGGFLSTSVSSLGMKPVSVFVADFNLDRKLDLAVTNYDSREVVIFLGNGMGGFTPKVFQNDVPDGLLALAVGDFNLDGRSDLVTVNGPFNTQMRIFWGTGTGGFTQAIGSPFPVAGVFAVAVGDFNLDGNPDLAVETYFLFGLQFLVGDGIGGFTGKGGFNGFHPFLAVEDFNLDGKPDVATPGTIFLNTHANTLPTLSARVVTGVAGGPSTNLQIATVNDAQDAPGMLSVKVNGGTSATVNGITVSNLSVNTAGVVKADVVAAASATNASFTLRATDSCGVSSVKTLDVGVVGFSVKLSDPAVCLGAGGVVGVTAQLANPNAAQATATFMGTPDGNLRALAGTCTASVGTCSVNANTNQVEWNGVLGAGQSVTINYRAQVTDAVLIGADLCVVSTASLNGGPPASVTACTKANCPPVGPGVLPQTLSPMSDDRPGSVLIYNLYTSVATGGEGQNTRIAITNTHLQQAAFVHLFFVAESCSVADSFLCLTPNQTATFLASDLDPGTSGYLVAVATDPQGCPANFNFLIGDEFVKLASGHATNLGAEAIAAIAGGLPVCDSNSVTAQLSFDGLSYAPVPRALALSNLASRADGNDTLLVLNRIGGNLGIGASTLGSIFGILYDDAEHGLSFSFSGNCQLRSTINNNFPRTAPRFEQFVPAGRSGWMRLYSQSDVGITGAAINFNANAASTAGAFNQGHNLHALTLTAAASYVIPVFPPNC